MNAFLMLNAQVFHGLSAVELLENEKLDLVVLDIMLPGLGGYQVFERAFGTPTIFLTAKSVLRMRCYRSFVIFLILHKVRIKIALSCRETVK